MSSVSLFVDTNLFLQCRDLDQLPWSELFKAEEIVLLVAAPVQEEIDRLKGDGNTRRSKRARRAASKLRQAIRSSELSVEIRPRGPRVVLAFAPPLDSSQCDFATLDRTRADDRLVLAVIAFREEQRSQDVRLFSQDLGPLASARRCNVPFTEIPDSWLLEPEPDERDKRIRDLSSRVQQLEQSHPALELTAQDMGGRTISDLEIVVNIFDPLCANEEEAIASKILEKFPLVTDFQSKQPTSQLGSSRTVSDILQAELNARFCEWVAATEVEIDAYQASYAKWHEDVRRRISELSDGLNVCTATVGIQLQLTNTGSRPAERVLLEVCAHDGISLHVDKDEVAAMDKIVEKRLTLPAPPAAPQGRYVTKVFGAADEALRKFSGLAELSGIGSPLRSPLLSKKFLERRTDPFSFEEIRGGWRSGSKRVLECEEFRHGLDPKRFRLSIVIPVGVKLERSYLRCRVSASNVAECIEVCLPICMSYDRKPALAVARAWCIEASDRPRPRRVNVGIS